MENELCVPDASPGDFWEATSMMTDFVPAHYIVQLPRNTQTRRPVIIFFRGASATSQPDLMGCEASYDDGSSKHWSPFTSKQVSGQLHSNIMSRAAEEGYIAVSVLGAPTPFMAPGNELHFGSPQGASGDAAAIKKFLNDYDSMVDRDRIFGVGFSMGGINALSYAARHLEPLGPHGMFAGLVLLSGHTSNSIRWNRKNSPSGDRRKIQGMLGLYHVGPPNGPPMNVGNGNYYGCDSSDPDVDDMNTGSPMESPFVYQRSSGVFTSCSNFPNNGTPDGDGVNDELHSLATNLLHIPVWGLMHSLDNDGSIRSQMESLDDLYGAVGHQGWSSNFQLSSGDFPGDMEPDDLLDSAGDVTGHGWGLYLAMRDGLPGSKDLFRRLEDIPDLRDSLPATARVLVADDGYHFHFDVTRSNPNALGIFRWKVVTPGNKLVLGEPFGGETFSNIQSLRVRNNGSLCGAAPCEVTSGLKPTNTLRVIMRPTAIGASPLTVTLEGYASPPSLVMRKVGGMIQFLPPGSGWVHNSSDQSLQLNQEAAPNAAVWTIYP